MGSVTFDCVVLTFGNKGTEVLGSENKGVFCDISVALALIMLSLAKENESVVISPKLPLDVGLLFTVVFPARNGFGSNAILCTGELAGSG